MSDLARAHKHYSKLVNGFLDHATFCAQCLTVETEARTLIPMNYADPTDPAFSPGQIRLQQAIEKQRKAGRPVRIIFLKSRRVRATTGTAAAFYRHTAFNPGVHTVVLAHDDTSVNNIFSIYERFHQKYRPYEAPPLGMVGQPAARLLSDRMYFPKGDDPESSFIQIHTAGSVNFGRSFRITNVHFSEFPYYPDSAGTLAAVMSAVPKTPDTCAIIEGTAKGIGDHFHKLWQQAVDPNSDSEWIPLFMGWWEHPANRMPLHVPPEKFQATLTDEERELQANYRLTFEQLWWRRWTIINDFGKDLTKFKREHPATPEEAFTASARTRFAVPQIQRMPVQKDPLQGDLVLDDLGPDKVIRFEYSERGMLRMWKKAEPGRCYAAGADPAGGSDANEGEGDADPDYAVCHIFDRDTGEQCATLRGRVWPGQFGKQLYVLLRYYNNAQICVERTGAGVGTLESLLNEGYPPPLIYHRPVTPDQDPQVRSDKIGWNTDEVSRQQALSLLDEAIRLGSIHVRDEVTQRELLTFIVNPKGKAEAERGCHDDTVFALAFVVIVMARMPRPVTQRQKEAPKLTKYGGRAPVETDSRGRRR